MGQPTSVVYWLATVQGFGILAGGLLLNFCGNFFQHWRWQMGVSVAWMTLFGGLLAYAPERQDCTVAFAFLSAAGFGYAQYLSITYIQFGADQIELGISGGLAGVSRTAGGAIATTVGARKSKYAATILADSFLSSRAGLLDNPRVGPILLGSEARGARRRSRRGFAEGCICGCYCAASRHGCLGKGSGRNNRNR